MKVQVKVNIENRRFSIEIPPIDWILKFEDYHVGKLKSGSVLVMEHYSQSDGVGLLAHHFKTFAAVFREGDFGAALKRALAHKLGIKRFRWKNAYTRPIWFPTDLYFFDGEGATPEEIQAHYEYAAAELEKQAGPAPAAAFRKQIGLPPHAPTPIN